VRAILEPSIEEFAFVTPRDAGSPFFAVSIKYRVNIYLPDGKLADSWGFTGYGTSPSEGLSSEGPLATATALAMRDAGAKLAVEFREQAIVRGLLPQPESADTQPKVISDLPSVSELTGSPAPADPSASPSAGADPSSEARPAGEAPPSEAPPSGEAEGSDKVAPSSEAAPSEETAPAGDEPADEGAPADEAAPPDQAAPPSEAVPSEAEPMDEAAPSDEGLPEDEDDVNGPEDEEDEEAPDPPVRTG
jgi:hypothetical protein